MDRRSTHSESPPPSPAAFEMIPTLARMLSRLSTDTSHGIPTVAWLLSGLCAVLSLSLFLHYGVLHGGDTTRFLSGADHLIRGERLVEKEGSYLGYLGVVALIHMLGLPQGAIVILQITFAAVASAALYDLGRLLAGPSAGIAAAAMFALNPEIARWHLFIYTDSLYISFVIFAVWAVHRATTRGGITYVLGAAVVLFTALLRPNGWILVPISLGYWIMRGKMPHRLRWALALIVCVGFVAVAASVRGFRQGIESQGPTRALLEGEVVWGYDGWRVPMPVHDLPPGSDWVSAANYVIRHPFATARLATSRVAAELVHARPFYSTIHNAFAVAMVLPIYLLAVVGFARTRTDPLARLLLTVIAGHLLIIAATFANWDGRFLLYFFPMILALAGAGIAYLLGVWSHGPVPRNVTGP